MADKFQALDPDALPSEEELVEANKLRDALQRPASGQADAGDDTELARALSAAWSPAHLGVDAHRAMVDRALANHAARRRRARVVVRASLAAGALVALAAGLVLVVGNRSPTSPSPPAAVNALVSTRSTQPLFSEPFARDGGETARVDRIAMARAADLRENEFARWGVR
jgi:hypothetical protein